jgi:hypothetical protein
VLLCYDTAPEVIQRLRDRGFDVFTPDPNDAPAQSVHARRFFHISSCIAELYPGARYVIATDVRDVAFQSDPSAWLEYWLPPDKSLCVPSEDMTFADQEWGRQNLIETFGDSAFALLKGKEIFNCGVVAGTTESMPAFCMAVYSMAHTAPGRITDQPAMNILLDREPWRSKVHVPKANDGFAATLGILAEPKYHPFVIYGLLVVRDGKVFTPDGSTQYAIVHQYDRIAYLAEAVNRKWWEA